MKELDVQREKYTTLSNALDEERKAKNKASTHLETLLAKFSMLVDAPDGDVIFETLGELLHAHSFIGIATIEKSKTKN
jgi:hypothetical protein